MSASKTLKALGKDGEPLKCVESDPSEELRESLKTVGKAAGPVIGSFIMGLFEHPRRKQGVILDAVFAARTKLFAANARSMFFRKSTEGGGAGGQLEESVLNRRATDDGVGAIVTQGTLAARKTGIEMLREYGLQVGNDEDLGNTKFELTVIEGAVQSQPPGGAQVAGFGAQARTPRWMEPQQAGEMPGRVPKPPVANVGPPAARCQCPAHATDGDSPKSLRRWLAQER